MGSCTKVGSDTLIGLVLGVARQNTRGDEEGIAVGLTSPGSGGWGAGFAGAIGFVWPVDKLFCLLTVRRENGFVW